MIGTNLQQSECVPVSPTKQFSDDGEKIPDSFRFSASERSEEIRPFGCRWRRSRAQVIHVAEHDGGGNAEFGQSLFDILVQRGLVQAPEGRVLRRRTRSWVGSAANRIDGRTLVPSEKLVQQLLRSR